MKRLIVPVVVLAICLAAAGCSASEQPSATDTEDVPAASDAATTVLASLEDGQSGSLEDVSLAPAGAYAVIAGTPEDTIASDHDKAELGVFTIVNGIETRLMIPVWYGDETEFKAYGAEPVPMPQAVQAASEPATSTVGRTAVWFGDAAVDVEFHMDAGVLILDKVEVPPTR